MTDPRIQARTRERGAWRGHRRLSILLSVLAAAALSAGALAILHTSLFGAAHDRGRRGGSHSESRDSPGQRSGEDTTAPRRQSRDHIEAPRATPVGAQRHGPRRMALDGGHRRRRTGAGGDGPAFAWRLRPPRLHRPRARGSGHAPGGAPARRSGRELIAAGRLARDVCSASARDCGPAPSGARASCREIVTGADGVVLRLSDGMRAVIGDDQALGEKFISLATVLAKVDLAGVGSVDLRVATAPVLTPLVSASNVQ